MTVHFIEEVVNGECMMLGVLGQIVGTSPLNYMSEFSIY